MHTYLNRTQPLTHPPVVSPYIYLTALCAPSKTFMTAWFNPQRQSFFFVYFLFTPVKRCGSLDITDFGWVVSWLDEQTQTWLPLCESSLLTSDKDPVWGVSTCVQLCVWNRKSGPAIKQQSVLLSTPTPLRCFICLDIYAFIKHYLAIGKEEKYTDSCAWL